MNKIVVCYKWVVDENDVSVDPNGAIKMREPSYKVSLYDRNAIEAAVQLAEKGGATCVALTAGDAKCEKSRKEALCAGPSAGYAVVDEKMEVADSYMTATVLAKAIGAIGDVDVVICGEGSGDAYAHQVGPRIAAELGLPFVGYVTDIEIEGEELTLKRACSEGVEVLKVAGPVAISVAGDSNTPRIPGIKDVMGAGKKPFTVMGLAELGAEGVEAGLVRTNMVGTLPDRKNIVIKGAAEDIAAEVVKGLISEGVLG